MHLQIVSKLLSHAKLFYWLLWKGGLYWYCSGGIVHFADTTEGKCHAELGRISPRGVEWQGCLQLWVQLMRLSNVKLSISFNNSIIAPLSFQDSSFFSNTSFSCRKPWSSNYFLLWHMLLWGWKVKKSRYLAYGRQCKDEEKKWGSSTKSWENDDAVEIICILIYVYIPLLSYSPPSRLTHLEAKRRKKWTVSLLSVTWIAESSWLLRQWGWRNMEAPQAQTGSQIEQKATQWPIPNATSPAQRCYK